MEDTAVGVITMGIFDEEEASSDVVVVVSPTESRVRLEETADFISTFCVADWETVLG